MDLSGEVARKSRLSACTMAMIATMREVGRLPIRTIQWPLGSFHCLNLSVGEIVNVLHLVGPRPQPFPGLPVIPDCPTHGLNSCWDT